MQNNLVSMAVGQPWPYPRAGEGLQAVLDPGPEGIRMMLVASLRRPKPSEIRALNEGTLRLGLLSHGPLIWIILSAGKGRSLDAPYGLGLGGPDRAMSIRTAAANAKAWPADIRQVLTLATIDDVDGIVRALRVMSLSRDWWRTFADLLDAAPSNMTATEHRSAMSASFAAYPSTSAMLGAARIVEIPGAI